MTHDEAVGLLRERMKKVVGQETVSLSAALGRITSNNVSAPHNVPLHTNSAVDGYAFRHADLSDAAMPVSLRIAAGDQNSNALQPGTIARIFTGAPMPEGADSVAMQEDCSTDGKLVSLPQGLKPGANCRQAGEDLSEGATLIQAGHRLRPADVAALASIGKDTVDVSKRLKVKLLSSGDELRRVGDHKHPLAVGQVWDSNTAMLEALLTSLPVDVTIGEVLADDPDIVESALVSAARSADVVITTGGASRGDEDHMLNVLANIGKRHLWQLAVKPGRPMMMGQINTPEKRAPCLFMGLPGNPVAAMVCFLLYVRPSLLALCGARWVEPARFRLPADFEIKNKKPDRREFLRGILSVSDNGETRVRKFNRDGSGLISSLRESDGLIEIPESATSVAQNELVNFIPFSSFS